MMETELASPYLLAILFFFVALIYSSVGLGGGSSYTALMAIFGMPPLVIPTVSLLLNLVATSAASFNFVRHRHGRLRLILPFLVTSIPLAYVGGALQVSETVFYWMLIVSLLIVVLRIYFWPDAVVSLDIGRTGQLAVALITGSLLGLVAGIVGIGGGIYLIPLIMILGLGSQKEAAAAGAVFIWFNSLAGLLSRFQYNPIEIRSYVPLAVAVLAGGYIGSLVGSSRLSPRTMEKILGAIIIVAILFLLRKVIAT